MEGGFAHEQEQCFAGLSEKSPPRQELMPGVAGSQGALPRTARANPPPERAVCLRDGPLAAGPSLARGSPALPQKANGGMALFDFGPKTTITTLFQIATVKTHGFPCGSRC